MISATARTMAILETLAAESGGLSHAEIQKRLQIEKSALSRILATLEESGYIVEDSRTHRLRVGLRFVGMAFRYIDSVELVDLSLPVLEDIADKFGELVQLAVVERDGLMYVAKVDGTHRIRVHSLLGREVVLHASTAGKVWLASLPEEVALGLVLKAGLTPVTKKTICSIDRFREELVRVREQGFAVSEEELFEGGGAVGVPIRVRRRGDDKVVGAVALSAPMYRLARERRDELVPFLRNAAERLAEVWPTTFRGPEYRGEAEVGITKAASVNRAPSVPE